MLLKREIPAIVAVTACLGACATNGIGPPNAAFAPAGEVAPSTTPGVAGASNAVDGYVLSDDERALDCKRLTGKIQIRILELRTYNTSAQTTALSRSMQSTGSTIMGGTFAGTDPQGEHGKKLAQVEAYNSELASRGCRSFDLAKELVAADGTPSASVPPPPKTALTAP